MSVIALNAMGGDRAPQATIDGAHLAAKDGIDVVLVGDETILRPISDLPIVHAPDVVAMDEDPMKGFRRSKVSSIRVATHMVKSGEASAVVDCGNTGVALAAATILLGRLQNFERPTIATKLPRFNQDASVAHSLLLDSGANIDPGPHMMAQWALLGSLYLRLTSGIATPRVGLVSNGEEANKGTELVKAAHELLRDMGDRDIINFIGNVQGGGCFDDSADVVITDGFTGNVMLKLAETMGRMQLDTLRAIARRTWLAKLGGMLLRPHLRPVKQAMDKRQAGGALLLGVNGVCIIGHGSSDEIAVANAIRRAQEAVNDNILPKLEEGYAAALAT